MSACVHSPPVAGVKGRLETKLDNQLTSSGVIGPCVWNQSFVGNDCHKILKPAVYNGLCQILLQKQDMLDTITVKHIRELHHLFSTSLKKLSQCFGSSPAKL